MNEEDNPDDDKNINTIAKFLNTFDSTYPRLEKKITRSEIGGLDEILEKLETFTRATKHPEMYKLYGVRPPRGFILYGPSGFGKTYVAKYLASELGARFMDIPLSMFESKYVGESAEKLSDIIHSARLYYSITQEPLVIFFDEAEEALKSRTLQGWHGPRVNVLLREMDGFSGDNEGLFFGAATNHLSKVDSAIMRPGRMDYHIAIKEYSASGMADVVRAVKEHNNMKAAIAGKFKPFKLSKKDCVELGIKIKALGLSPAHVNEAFKRAADQKIKQFIEQDAVIDNSRLYICRRDIESGLYSLENKTNEKRLIGYGRW